MIQRFRLIKSFLQHPQSFQKRFRTLRHLTLTSDLSLLPALWSNLSPPSVNQKVDQKPRPTVHLQTDSSSLTLTGLCVVACSLRPRAHSLLILGGSEKCEDTGRCLCLLSISSFRQEGSSALCVVVMIHSMLQGRSLGSSQKCSVYHHEMNSNAEILYIRGQQEDHRASNTNRDTGIRMINGQENRVWEKMSRFSTFYSSMHRSIYPENTASLRSKRKL